MSDEKLQRLQGDGPIMTNASVNRNHAARMFKAGMSPEEIARAFPAVFTFKRGEDGGLGQKYDSIYVGSGRKETRFMIKKTAVDEAIREHKSLRGTKRGRLVRTHPGYNEDRLDLPGWSVGWNDEISAHAAVRGHRSKLFVMTAPEYDGAPRSLDDEVAVGIYKLNDDEWEQIGYGDFDSVSEVLAMSIAELERVIMNESESGMRETKRRSKARLAKFWFDDGPEAVGWSLGETWNGFGVPYFSEDQLPRALAALREVGLRVSRQGKSIVISDPDTPAEKYDPEYLDGRLVWKFDGFTWNEATWLRSRPR